jgi:predicted ATPase
MFSISRKSSFFDDPMVVSAKDREAINLSKFPITRICLTGGPCAGKTTALATLSIHLKQIGYRVLLVPEAATLLMNGGALIQTPTMGIASQVKFQISLMKLQMNLEDIFVDIAQSSDIPTIILCDRGVMDGSAYTDSNVWQAILDETGWSTIQLRDRRYEAVVHMVSAADGAEKFYTLENNGARYESVQEAVELDKRLINAWVGHPHFSIIQNNSKSFQDKIDQCLSTVLNFIGLPTPSAYVKKFLLIVDKSTHDFKVPNKIKKEFFQVDETFLQVKNLGFEEGEATNIVRKIGKNDSFIYSQEIRYVQN